MTFRVFLHLKAAKSLEKLQQSIQDRVKNSLRELEPTPEKGNHLKPSNFWRLRIGDYRAIYEIDRAHNRIVVLYIGQRKNVYDEFSKLL